MGGGGGGGMKQRIHSYRTPPCDRRLGHRSFSSAVHLRSFVQLHRSSGSCAVTGQLIPLPSVPGE